MSIVDGPVLVVAEPVTHGPIKRLRDPVPPATLGRAHNNHRGVDLGRKPSKRPGGIAGKRAQRPLRGRPGPDCGADDGFEALRHGPDVLIVLVRMQRKAVGRARRIPFHEVACLVHVGAQERRSELLGQRGCRLEDFGMLARHYADEQGRRAAEALWGHTPLCSPAQGITRL